MAWLGGEVKQIECCGGGDLTYQELPEPGAEPHHLQHYAPACNGFEQGSSGQGGMFLVSVLCAKVSSTSIPTVLQFYSHIDKSQLIEFTIIKTIATKCNDNSQLH